MGVGETTKGPGGPFCFGDAMEGISDSLVWLIGGAFFLLLLGYAFGRPRKKHGWSRKALREFGCAETDSPIEEILLRAMRRHGLPEPELQFGMAVSVGQNRLRTIADFAFPQSRVVIYCDGIPYHSALDQRIWDARVRNALAVEGWTVLVYLGPQIVRFTDGCVAEIRRALALSRE